MKLILLPAALVLLLLTSCGGVNVGQTMKEMGKAFGALNKAAAQTNYSDSRQAFQLIIDHMSSLSNVNPRKGTKQQWDSMHNAIIADARKGIQAADATNYTALLEAVSNIGIAIKPAHQIFR